MYTKKESKRYRYLWPMSGIMDFHMLLGFFVWVLIVKAHRFHVVLGLGLVGYIYLSNQ